MKKFSFSYNLADQLLLHIVSDFELLNSMLGRSGMDVSQLKELVNDPAIHEFVLDFVTENDERVIACSEAIGVSPGEISMSARMLAGRG